MKVQLTNKEKEEVISDFNNTETPYSADKTVMDMFAEQAMMNPDKIAVICDDKTYTYGELNNRSNKLACYLRYKKVEPDDIVAVMVERSYEMIVGIFAILKAGGGYLPIDPQYPMSRKEMILRDSNVRLVLTMDKFKDMLPDDMVEAVNLNNEEILKGFSSGTDLHKITSPHDIAYVIYTSGTSGIPKGVVIEHHSLVNRLQWMQKKYGIDSTDVILQKTIYTFDVSVWEIFLWAISGASVCMLKPKKEHDVRAFVKLIEKNRVTVMHFVPSVLRVFLEYIETQFNLDRVKSLKWVFSSGETLGSNIVNKFNGILGEKYQAALVNLYGPTEATIDVTYFNCHKNVRYTNVPIGKPIDNTRIYILDEELNPLPVNAEGELYISGVGVAREYLNRKELTRKCFIDDPFVPGMRMYKTGDIAKWNDKREVCYIGRKDNQVKLRGLRIELGEVEHHICCHERVEDAVVCVKEDISGNQHMIAFVIPATTDNKAQPGELTEYLKDRIPMYMIPTAFVFLSEFPLKASGKVDRSKLTMNE